MARQYNDSSIAPKDFTLSLDGKILVADPQVSIGAPVFEGASLGEVMSYFKKLSGIEEMPANKLIPGKGRLYYATTPSGAKITLRNFSTSAQKTGTSWTIDIMDSSINGGRRVEVKFK